MLDAPWVLATFYLIIALGYLALRRFTRGNLLTVWLGLLALVPLLAGHYGYGLAASALTGLVILVMEARLEARTGDHGGSVALMVILLAILTMSLTLKGLVWLYSTLAQLHIGGAGEQGWSGLVQLLRATVLA